MGIEEDLQVVIALVLGTDASEMTRDFRERMRLLERATAGDAEDVGKRTAANVNKGFAKEARAAKSDTQKSVKNLYGSLGTDAAKAIRDAGPEITGAQQRILTAQIRLYQDHLRERLTIVRQGLDAETRAGQFKYNKTILEQRQAGAKELQTQRSIDQQIYVSEQASQARRTARARAFYRTLTSTVEAGLRGGNTALQSFLRRREEKVRQSENKITDVYQTESRQQTSAIRQSLDQQNAVYSRSARARLATIERNAATETRVITGAAVKQAKAVATIQAQTSRGVIGAASGRSGIGGRGLLAAVGGGVVGSRIFTTLADFQSIETALKGIYDETEGRAPKTTEALKQLQDFAKKTPFSMKQLAEITQKFFANGLVDPKAPKALDEIKTKLLSIANAASATGKTRDQVDGAILGITQISASGRLSLEDLRQVTEGIGIRLSDVAKALGLSTKDLFKSLEQGKIGAVEGLDAIFEAMNNVPGAAGAAARQAGNLRGALSNLGDVTDQLIVKTLKPLGAQVAILISGFAEFAGKLLDGQGVYKVIREGLIGISIGLGAILAAKGAIEALGLLNSGLSLLAANPGILALVGLGAAAVALYRNVPAIQSFFGSLIEGTVNWAKVGFQIDGPIKNLSRIVQLQTSLGATARTVKDFFDSLVSGTKFFVQAGSTLDAPISSLSNLIAIQTSVGFAAKKISSSFNDIRQGAVDLASGLGTTNLKEAVKNLVFGLAEGLGPVKDKLIGGLRETFQRVADFLGTEVGPILSSARLNLAGILVGFLFGGGDQGFISGLITRRLSGSLIGAIKGIGTAQPGVEFGQKISDAIDSGFKIAKATTVNVGKFLSGLFSSQKGGDGTTANDLGKKLRQIVIGGISRIGDIVGPIGALFSVVAGAIGFVFTKFVLPQIIELPRIIGRFISRTAFSEEFLKTVFSVTAAVAAAAIIMAAQFVRGFIEGLISRRGDIASAILDIFKLPLQGFSGLLLATGATLVAFFVGAKILGAITRFRTLAKAAFTPNVDGLKATREAVRGLVKDQQTTGSKLGDGLLKLRGGYDTVSNAIGRTRVQATKLGISITNLGPVDRFVSGAINQFKKLETAPSRVGPALDRLANKILKLPPLAYTTASGALRDSGTKLFIKDTTDALSKARLITGQGVARIAGEYQKIAPQVQAVYTKIGRYAKAPFAALSSAAQFGFGKLQTFGSGAVAKVKEQFKEVGVASGVAQTALAAAGAGITGYFAGAADTAQAKVTGIVAAFGSIAAAAAIAGAPGAAIATATAAIGFFFGEAARKSKAAKEEAVKQTNELKAAFESARDFFFEVFRQVGSVASNIRGLAVVEFFKSKVGDNSKGVDDFLTRFGGSVEEAAAAAEKGRKPLEDYFKTLTDTAYEDVLYGRAKATKAFASEISAAAGSLGALPRQIGPVDASIQAAGEELRRQLSLGLINVFDYEQGLVELGFSWNDSAADANAFTEALRKQILQSDGGEFIRKQGAAIEEAARQQRLYNELQDAASAIADRLKPYGEKVVGVYDKIRDSIDKAKNAYKAYVDLQNGKKVDEAQTRVDLRGIGKEATTGVENESSSEAADRKFLAKARAQTALQDVIGRIGEGSATIEQARDKLDKYFGTLTEGLAQDDPLRAFFDDLQRGVSDGQLEASIDTQPAIESIEGLEGKLKGLIASNPDLQAVYDNATAKGKVEILRNALTNLRENNLPVKQFLETNGFDVPFGRIKNDLDLFTSKPATKKVLIAISYSESHDGPSGFDAFLEQGGRKALISGFDNVLPRKALGGLIKKTTALIAGEAGDELILPLTNPARMAELLSLPDVQRAFARIPSDSAPLPSVSSSFGLPQGFGSSDSSHNVDLSGMTIIEPSPRATAIEIVRQAKAGSFRSGATLGAR